MKNAHLPFLLVFFTVLISEGFALMRNYPGYWRRGELVVVKDTEKLLELLATSAGTTVFPILVAGTFVSLITRNTEKEIAANKDIVGQQIAALHMTLAANKDIVGQQIAALHTTLAANDKLVNQRIAAEKVIVGEQIAALHTTLAANKDIVGQQIAALHTTIAANKEIVGQQIAALHTTIAANDKRIAAEKEIVAQQIAALYTAVAAEKESVQFERKELEKVFVEKFEKFENALRESKLLN